MTMNNNQKIVVVSPAALAATMMDSSKPEARPATKPLAQPLAASKKALQSDFKDGRRQAPKPPYDAATQTTFNPKTTFHPTWETSNFYDLFLPEGTKYVEMGFFGEDNNLADTVAEYERVGKQGYYSKFLSEKFRVLIGDWDDHGTALLVPTSSPVKTLADLGLTITIASKKDRPKARKYLRRLHAHHEWAVRGQQLGHYAAPNGMVTRSEEHTSE